MPGNVPYFVDNLWELTRPDDKPSRRKAVYASPTVELAFDGAAGVGQPREGFIVCRVECSRPPNMFQLPVTDARYHPDVKRLQKLVHGKLGGAVPPPLSDRLALAPLFLPGIARHELMAAMEENGALRQLVEELVSRVTLWTDTPDPVRGEQFFELDKDNSYTLHAV
ncbi:hypothetical protein G4G28_10925 [Massilia sp. Dwa41.01b]|uniref:hypothetical protein n=1 Tax=unclassified Massilia TaxID=2609279 RepID=UPI0015FF1AC9|nr:MULTISPECIES: hypothetical protein [unclassified Massilia]QNA88869.1 hypothetical protein G4G28_10925 [Massilia sp. Dwa41.01b]QNA99762.1 hypothetical protein G4G31_14570 [Massilia sp. Se16.2.3]